MDTCYDISLEVAPALILRSPKQSVSIIAGVELKLPALACPNCIAGPIHSTHNIGLPCNVSPKPWLTLAPEAGNVQMLLIFDIPQWKYYETHAEMSNIER